MFGGPANGWIGMWIRQKSIDGQSVIRADARSRNGAASKDFQIFNFDDKDNFVERLEAASGELHDGYWVLHNAVVVIPGFETMPVSTYLLATKISIEQRSPRRSSRLRRCRFGACPGSPTRPRAPGSIRRLTS